MTQLDPADQPAHNPTIDLSGEAGQAIVDLFGRLKEQEQLAGGDWPGAEVVDLLGVWLDKLGISADASADALRALADRPITVEARPYLGPPLEADDGTCPHEKINLQFGTTVYVVIEPNLMLPPGAPPSDLVMDVVYADQGDWEPALDVFCMGCDRTVHPDHPRVTAAAKVLHDPAAVWPAGRVGTL